MNLGVDLKRAIYVNLHCQTWTGLEAAMKCDRGFRRTSAKKVIFNE